MPILALAITIRLLSVGFGLPALNDPDELMFELGALRMLREPTLNPGWFGHPATTTMYLLALVNLLVFLVASTAGVVDSAAEFARMIYADPSWVILPGRIAMIIFAMGTIVLGAHLGEIMGGRRAALIAATLIALSPIHVTWGQIIRSDMMAGFFMLLCLLAVIRLSNAPTPRQAAEAGAWLALATVTKWPFAFIGVGIAGALALAVRRDSIDLGKACRLMLVAIGTVVTVAILVSPFLLLDHATVVRNIAGEGRLQHLGATGGSPAWNLSWYLSGPILKGLGPVALALLVFAPIALRRNATATWIVTPSLVAYLAVLASQSLVWERWALPIILLGAPLVAGTGARILERLETRGPAACVPIGAGLALLAFAPMTVWLVGDTVERWTDTRQSTSEWVIRHVPARSVILIEHFAFDLIQQPYDFLFPLGDRGCVDARALLRGKVQYPLIDEVRGNRSKLDFGTLPSEKAKSCSYDYAILTNHARYAEERGSFRREYANYHRAICGGRVIYSLDPKPGERGGPQTLVLLARAPARDRRAVPGYTCDHLAPSTSNARTAISPTTR